MPSARRPSALAGLLICAAVVLTACSDDSTEAPSRSTTSSAAPAEEPAAGQSALPSVAPAPDGTVDEVVAMASLAMLTEEETAPGVEVFAGPDGLPVVLLVLQRPEGEALALARQAADGGWELQELPVAGEYLTVVDAAIAPDGTIVVGTFVGTSFVVTRVTPDGQAATVPGPADLHPMQTAVGTALSADGGTLFVTAVSDGGQRLLTLDPRTGAETATAPLEEGTRPFVSRVAPGGGLVVARHHVTGSYRQPTSLVRFDAALQPSAPVELTPGDDEAHVQDLAVAADGTAYVVVFVAEHEDPAEIRLLAVAPGASEPRVLATYDGWRRYDLLLGPGEPRLLLDETSGTVHLLDVAEGRGASVTLTTVGTEAVGIEGDDEPVLTVAAPAQLSDASVTADGQRVFVLGWDPTAEGLIEPVLWTVG